MIYNLWSYPLLKQWFLALNAGRLILFSKMVIRCKWFRIKWKSRLKNSNIMFCRFFVSFDVRGQLVNTVVNPILVQQHFHSNLFDMQIPVYKCSLPPPNTVLLRHGRAWSVDRVYHAPHSDQMCSEPECRHSKTIHSLRPSRSGSYYL